MSHPLPTALNSGLVGCGVCHLLVPAPNTSLRARCPRCGAALHQRKPNSLHRTWALVLAALIFYIPANVLPITVVTSLGMKQADTIMSGVIYFIHSGSWEIAAIIFIAALCAQAVSAQTVYYYDKSGAPAGLCQKPPLMYSLPFSTTA